MKYEFINTGELPSCRDVRNKTFTLKRILSPHQHIHNGGLPCFRDVCNMSFNLQEHKIIQCTCIGQFTY